MHIIKSKIKRIFFSLLIWFCKWLGMNHPLFLVKIRYFVRFHKRLNMQNPKSLNEKILWLSFNTDTEVWSQLTDKYKVREYVSELGLERYLVDLYGMWESVDSLDFNMLPDSFIIKANHGSGDSIIVQDKKTINAEDIKKKLSIILKTKYGVLESGRHYYNIKPCIIIEELLLNDSISTRYSSSLIDYKIWCFNGTPKYIWVCTNRTKKCVDVMTYDLDWNAHLEYSVFNDSYRRSILIPKPKNFDEMMFIAGKLSSGFPCVRVDLYNLDGRIYFGEMTFTSLGGLMNFYTEDFLLKCGEMIDLNLC